jgi:molybdopterin converting factor small subunit
MSSISVRIPTILRSYTDGEAEVKASGSTVREVVADLEASFAGIAARILDDNGKIRRFVNVYVGEEDVRFADGLDTATPAGAQISIIPAVAGG